MDETLLPTENQHLANIRHYGLLLFLAMSLVLMLIVLMRLVVS